MKGRSRMNLNRELKKLQEQTLKNIPEEYVEVMLKDVEIQVKKGLTKNALAIGETIPNFKLENAVGEQVDVKDLLENGPLVISFYRGAWCPYCNMELAAYQEVLSELTEAGGQLVAISPELPDASMSLIEKHGLKYQILSDVNNEVARQFGLVFKLSDSLQKVYSKLGLDLSEGQGNSNYELPFPATYVINSDGRVVEMSVQYDYTQRLEPDVAIERIKECVY
jgi:peroxiredoxin